jgi:hypothetical protein
MDTKGAAARKTVEATVRGDCQRDGEEGTSGARAMIGDMLSIEMKSPPSRNGRGAIW